jgi:hypothetical protein
MGRNRAHFPFGLTPSHLPGIAGCSPKGLAGHLSSLDMARRGWLSPGIGLRWLLEWLFCSAVLRQALDLWIGPAAGAVPQGGARAGLTVCLTAISGGFSSFQSARSRCNG